MVKQQPASYFFRKGISLYGRIVVCTIPFMAPTELIDKSKTPPTPTIFVANHFSSIDPYCFGVVNTEQAMLTSWPFAIPFFKSMMKGGEYIDTRKGWDFIQQSSRQLLQKQCNLIIWPEGHRSRDGRVGKFERGAFRLAVQNKCPITPVCFVNTDKVMSPGSRLLSPYRPKVILLPAIYPTQDEKPRRAIKKLCNDTRQAIIEELSRHGYDNEANHT